LGIFRWRGIYENLDFVLEQVANPAKRVIDFGGAACPLGFGSDVLDTFEQDASGRTVPYHLCEEIGHQVDTVFSSHTLEHIPNLTGVLQQIADILVPGGVAIFHVPAYTCARWNVGNHKNNVYNDHAWTFGLEGTASPEGIENYIRIDTAVSKFLSIEKADYCGDNSIFLVARKI